MTDSGSPCGDRDYGPGCDRHKGDPHNLCQACWALEPDVKPSPVRDRSINLEGRTT